MNNEELLAAEREKGLENMIYEGSQEEQDYAYNRLRDIDNGEGQPNAQNAEPANNNGALQQNTPVEQQQPQQKSQVSVENNGTPQQTVEKNVFTTAYMGNEVSMPDPDGYMGRSDLDGLKNSFVHNNHYIETLKSQMDERDQLARSEIEKIAKEKEAIQKEREDLMKQLDALNKFQQNQQQQPMQSQSFQQPAQPQQNQYQSHPQQQNDYGQYQQNTQNLLPSDIMEWEDQQVNTINNNLGKIPTLEEKLKQMESDIGQYKTRMQQEEETRKKAEEEKAIRESERKYFDEINSFIQGNSYFSDLGDDILKYDGVVNNWMNNVAAANGLHRPYTNDPASMQNYEAQKLQLAQSYMSGDPVVMSKTSHIEKPKGLEKYYEFSNFLKKRDDNYKLTNGDYVPLVERWAAEQYQNGNLQNGVNNAVNNAYKEGAQAMANIQGDVANHAVNLPNNASQINESEVDVTTMSQDEIEKIIYSDPVRRMQDPQLEKQFQAVSQYLNSVNTGG